jgi:hypothetical protein
VAPKSDFLRVFRKEWCFVQLDGNGHIQDVRIEQELAKK